MACRRLLLDHGRILLGALIDSINCPVDFIECRGLLPGSFDDGNDVIVDVVNLRRNPAGLSQSV